MKKHRFIVPLLFSIWPIPCGGAILLFNTILGSEATLIIVGATFPMLLLAGIIMNIIISGQYRQEEQYKQLAFWGMTQKLSYIPFLYLFPQIGDIDFGENNLDIEKHGMMGLMVVAMMGMVIVLLLGILLLGMCIGLIVSATYTIKAINGLYRKGRLRNGVRILLIIGSLVFPLDIPIAIAVWGLQKRIAV